MTMREEITNATLFYPNAPHQYGVTWNGRAFHDVDTYDLVNKVIQFELDAVTRAMEHFGFDPENVAPSDLTQLSTLMTYHKLLSSNL